MRSPRVLISVGLAVIAIGVSAYLTTRPSTSFPTRASATYPDGASSVAFRNAGELVATAAYVVKGEVVAVERGEPARYPDGSGVTITPRIIVVEVSELLNSRDPAARAPTTLRITDGYWDDGVGYERESVGWASPGQVGYFLVRRDRAPDGTLMSTYGPIGGSGVALVEGERMDHDEQGVWRELGHDPTPARFRRALDRGVADARSGAARPVASTVCYPSVPGDEQSEPICVEE